MNQERHGNCCVLRAIFFFALCMLLFLVLLAGRHLTALQTTTDVFLSSLYVFLWMYLRISEGVFSWTGNGKEWIFARVWCFVFRVFFVVVYTIFILCGFVLGSWELMWPRAKSWRWAKRERNKQTNNKHAYEYFAVKPLCPLAPSSPYSFIYVHTVAVLSRNHAPERGWGDDEATGNTKPFR